MILFKETSKITNVLNQKVNQLIVQADPPQASESLENVGIHIRHLIIGHLDQLNTHKALEQIIRQLHNQIMTQINLLQIDQVPEATRLQTTQLVS